MTTKTFKVEDPAHFDFIHDFLKSKGFDVGTHSDDEVESLSFHIQEIVSGSPFYQWIEVYLHEDMVRGGWSVELIAPESCFDSWIEQLGLKDNVEI